jgi:ferredoxin
MRITRVRPIFFSPTGTSKKIVDAIAEGYPGVEAGDEIELTYPHSPPFKQPEPGELVVIGVPVYAGRVANLAAERLRTVNGNGALAVLVVLYGNREYEDALLELRDLAEELGFKPVAGASFIGEHSFSTEGIPLADGRPDGNDISLAQDFAKRIAASLGHTEKGVQLVVPGNKPYKEGMGNIPVSPAFDAGICSACGVCVELCPTGAISLEDELAVDGDLCILCCSCVRACPEAAVALAAPPLQEKMVWLYENCKSRKEPELFLPT